MPRVATLTAVFPPVYQNTELLCTIHSGDFDDMTPWHHYLQCVHVLDLCFVVAAGLSQMTKECLA